MTGDKGASIRRKPVVLLSPPPSDPTQAYTSLPALTAYMRRSGFTVVQRDLGIELLDALLTPQALAEAFLRGQDRAERCGHSNGLSEEAARSFRERFWGICGWSSYLIEHVEEAKRVTRDPVEFYDLKRYAWASSILRAACDLASLPYHPTRLSPVDYETPADLSLTGLVAATSGPEENPFYEEFQRTSVPEVLSLDPLLVGISVTYRFQVIPGFTLARLLKQAAPGLHVCIGGAIMHRAASFLLRDSGWFQFADSYVVGEGETALQRLTESIASETAPGLTPNLITLVDGNPRAGDLAWCEDVAELPLPDFEGLDLKRLLVPEPVFLVSSTRGCYHGKCAFCDVSRNTRSRYRPVRLSKLFDYVEQLRRLYGAKRFFFCDDAMAPVTMSGVAEFIEKSMPDVTWQAEARLEATLTHDVLAKLKTGGCRQLIFGFESACQRILDLMGKRNNVQRDEEILAACASHGIAVNLQSFVGFPTETPEEAELTVEFLLSNQNRVASIGFGVFTLFEGTPVYSDPERFGIQDLRRAKKNPVFDGCEYTTCAAGMTNDEAVRFYQESMKRLAPIYGSRNYLVYGTHSLLHFSRRSCADVLLEWQEIIFPPYPDEPNLDDLNVVLSRAVLLTPESGLASPIHRALQTDSGKQLELLPRQRDILDLCIEPRTVGEISSLWAERESAPGEDRTPLLAYAIACIHEFLRDGVVVPTADAHAGIAEGR